MDITWSALLIVLGLVTLGVAQGLAKKAETRKIWTWVGVGGAAVGVVALFILPTQLAFLNANVGFLSGLGGGTQTQQIVPIQQQQRPLATTPGCIGVEDTTVTFSALDKFTAVAVGGQHAYKVNGGAIRRVSDAGTDTLSPGDKLEVLFGNATVSASYISEVKTLTVPCAGTFEAKTELGQNGTMTVEVFNEEGNLIASPENETLAAGDVVTLTANFKGTYQRAPFINGGIVIAEFNSSDFDDVIVDFGGSKTGVPDFFTVSNTANSAKAYTIPAVLSNQILRGSLTLDVDATNNPGDGNAPVLRFYPNNFFVNEDTGATFDGAAVEDEDDVRTYQHITVFTVTVD